MAKEYKVKSLYCNGKKKVYKSGDIVTGNEIDTPEEKVNSGHLIVWDDAAKKAEADRLKKIEQRDKDAADKLKTTK